jgi:DUF2971 family protein
VHLYKYLSPSRVSVLRELGIRFTPPTEFNDPFEVVPNVATVLPPSSTDEYLADFAPQARQYFEEALDKELAAYGLPVELKSLLTYPSLGHDVVRVMARVLPFVTDEMRPTFGRRMQERFGKKFGILSLAESPANLLMWAHYGDSHKGFVIEFDAADKFFDQRQSPVDTLRYVRKIEYSIDRPAITLFDPAEDDVAHAERMVAATLLTKGQDWSYEREWRLILPLDEPEAHPREVRGEVHLFPVAPSAITAVILGSRCSEELRAAVNEALTSHEELAHVELRQASTSHTRYEVTIQPLARSGTLLPSDPITHAKL